MKGKESKEMAEPQLLEAAKISQAVNSVLADDYPSWKIIREAIKNVFLDHETTSAWIDNCDYHEQLIDESGRPMDLNPWNVDGLINDFRRDLILQYQIIRMNPPNLSGVGLSFFSSQAQTTPRFLMVDDIFIKGMEPGQAGIIYGVPGSGKTDLGTEEIYRCCVKKPNWMTTYNIKVNDPSPYSKMAGMLSATVKNMCVWARDGEKNGIEQNNSWIFDEAQRDRDRQTSGKSENISQKHLSLVLRKLNCFQWLIYQQRKPPSEVEDFASIWIEKPSFSNKGLVNLKNNAVGINMKISGIPGLIKRKELGLEYYEYETKHFAGLYIDLFVHKMFAYIISLGDMDVIGYYDEIIKYCDRCQGENAGFIDRQSELEMAFIIHERLKDSPDKIDRKVSEISYLAHMFGWDDGKSRDTARREMSRGFAKLREKGEPPSIKDPEDVRDIGTDSEKDEGEAMSDYGYKILKKEK
jgi:hypothetical protein